MSYTFTSDWFSNNIPIWNNFFSYLRGKSNLNFIEIGSYEGRSSIWMLENILTHPTSKLTCIDVFDGHLPDNDMTTDPSLNIKYYTTFLSNIEPFKDRVTVHKGYSYQILRTYQPVPIFDFAYIDGAHTAYETLTDAVLIDPLMKSGGHIIFDDYPLKDPSDESPQNNPELAVNSFCEVYAKQYEILHRGWQVILRKK